MKNIQQLILALSLAGAASLAAAQGQSPANAHAFLEAVARAHPVLVTDFAVATPLTHDVVALESSGCRSKFTSRAPGGQPVESTLDWQTIRTTQVEGERDLRIRGRGVDTMLGFESRELAVRVANALTMVRRNCDPISGFGF
jgi:hypothetical protein